MTPPNPLQAIISNIKDTILPMVGQQPIAQSRIGRTPIYAGSANSQNLGATFPTMAGSRITMSPEALANPALGETILKHEIIHALVNKHGVDTSKLNYEDPENFHYKDNLPHRELISYALAGGADGKPVPEIKAAMEKSILSDKKIPDGFKNDLHRLGVLSQGAAPQIAVPAGYQIME